MDAKSERIEVYDEYGIYITHYFSAIKPCVGELIRHGEKNYVVKTIMHKTVDNGFYLSSILIKVESL